MSEDGDVDVESAEDVPDIGVEATTTTTNGEYEGGPHDKRAHHNALERRRRDHIKDSFHGLRDCIPSLVGEKVSRAHILNKATEYIRHMQKGGSNREDDICDLARRNEILEEQVRALDDARACGGPFSAEELLQGVASRVQARQAQEIVIQQLQAKTKPTRQQAKAAPKPAAAPPNPVSASPAASAPNGGPKSAKSTETTPTSSPSLNLLANNIKSTQSLLSALQKNFNNPNSNLPPNIKSLAARVLASPLVRGAAQKSAQASLLPRGIVTATTVPKGSNLSSSSPSSAAPVPAKSPASASTGTNTGETSQHAESALSESGLLLEMAPIGGKASADIETSTIQVQAAAASSVGGVSLTSQLMEAHNLLQQQGGGAPTVVESPADIPSLPLGGITTAQGLNISPELLAQVSSLLNLPTVPIPSSAPSLGGDSSPLLSPQDSLHPSLQATPTAPSSSQKRPPPPSGDHTPPAKKPHIEQ